MMETSQTVPEFVAAQQADAKGLEVRVADVLKLMDGQAGSDTQAEELRATTLGIEKAAIDMFTHFEGKMQHHFRRGPFSRKLEALLLEAGKTDLADKVHQYYLAINVLKHGKGASHRELLGSKKTFVVLRPSDEPAVGEASMSLVDVTAAGFFDGLANTILEAHQFLESRAGV